MRSPRIVPHRLLQALAARAAPAATAAPSKPKDEVRRNGQAPTSRLDVGKWLQARGINYKTRPASHDRTAYLITCPFDSSHAGTDCAIMQDGAGKLSAKCFHNACAGKGWKEFKDKIGPPNNDHWEPPLRPKAQAGKDKKSSQATRLIEYAGKALKLFHAPEGEAFATTRERPRRTWALRTRAAKQYLSRLFYLQEQTAPGSDAIQTALTTLEGIAIHDGPETPVFTRLAEWHGKIYLDLGDDSWRAVQISPGGWKVVAEPPVKFRRSRGLLALPEPAAGGSLADLRRFINVQERDWPLVVAWLLQALRPSGPYPVLCLNGEQGTAKSTTARVLRALVDPNTAPLRSEPRDPRDLIIAATNGWLVALDNLSHLRPRLSDCLCRLATGGGFGTRQLYTDADEMLFEAKRPVILNGIEELATSGDLLERSLIITLPVIPEDQRRTEARLWSQFGKVKARILGALLDAIAAGLRNRPKVRLKRLPRMADFAKWIVACEPALGWEPDTFLDAYQANVHSANALVLESSPVTRYLIEVVRDVGEWKGTATELLAALERNASTQDMDLESWPKTARGLAGVLRRLAPNLRRDGLDISFSDHPLRGRGRAIRIRPQKVATHRSHRSHRSQPANSLEEMADE
jgi:hypothetical protein